jgi:hypothetical protein
MSSFGIVDPTKIALRKVKIAKAIIEHPDDSMPIEIKGFKTDVAFKTALNLEDKLVKTELELKIETDSEGSASAICNYYIHFIFYISNLNDLAKIENNALIVSKSLHSTLASVSYSTARGMLLDRLQNTVFEDFILPIVNSNNLIKS